MIKKNIVTSNELKGRGQKVENSMKKKKKKIEKKRWKKKNNAILKWETKQKINQM